jgi:hypothetical protein
VGDDAREAAGENTPTPDSFSLEKSDSSNAAPSSANMLMVSSVAPLESCEVELLSSVGEQVEEDEVSSTWIDGIVSLDMSGLSVVDALTSSTTPSVRATTYDEMSCI